MKIVVRSSSLLFTLLSIVLHVPIQRVKRSVIGDAPLAEKELSSLTEETYRQRQPPDEHEPVVTGEHRRNS
jgi:hypothetical protein